MEKSKKIINIISVIELILAILGLLGALLFTGLGIFITASYENEEIRTSVIEDVADNPQLMEKIDYINNSANLNLTPEDVTGIALVVGIAAILFGISDAVAGVCNMLIFIFGRRAVKGKSPKGAFVMGIIGIVLDVIGLVTILYISIFSGILMYVIDLLLLAAYTYNAYKLKKEYE